MSIERTGRSDGKITIENIGGIDHTTIEIEPGTTILTGRNATNRTSILQAIMAVCGSSNASLKGDAEEGHVELTLGDTTYVRELRRENDGSISFSGEPYLDDATLANHFTFLLESNDCRRAVAGAEDLREIIMRPVDTEEIKSDIRNLENEKNEIGAEIEHVDSLRDRLPELESQKRELKEKIGSKEEEREEKEDELAAFNARPGDIKEEKAELDDRLDELGSKRKEMETLRDRIESEKESIEALRNEREKASSTLEECSDASDTSLQEIEQEVERRRGKVQALDCTIDQIQSVIQFNEDVLDDGTSEIATHLDDDSSNEETVTDQLLSENQSVTCWTCGSSVETEEIESTLDQLRSVRDDNMERQRSFEAEIQELEEKKRTLEDEQRKYEQTKRKLRKRKDEITEREEKVEDLRRREQDTEAEIDDLEEEVEALQNEEYSEILELHTEINQLEFTLDDLRTRLAEKENDITSLESKLDEREELEQRREEVSEQLEDLRTHVEDLQDEAVANFNEHMEAMLDLLEYENLVRIWIERVTKTVRQGRRNVEEARFELHVVRSTDSGAAYEDTVDHLSESEREVTGLIFALAGYLVHDVHETIPFMLLDSIEAIDSNRIASLVEYLQSYADYLVVALLEEDAAALDNDYSTISLV